MIDDFDEVAPKPTFGNGKAGNKTGDESEQAE